MTAVLESKDVSQLSSTELDEALQRLLNEQRNRASIQQARQDIACAFVLMARGLKGCRLLDLGEEQMWRVTGMANTSLSGAAETFGKAASRLSAGASKLVLQSLAAECYHLIGEQNQSVGQARHALGYKEHPDTGPLVGSRLVLCRQLVDGQVLIANSGDQLDPLQDLVLAA